MGEGGGEGVTPSTALQFSVGGWGGVTGKCPPHVFWFQVPVGDALAVQVSDAAEKLQHDAHVLDFAESRRAVVPRQVAPAAVLGERRVRGYIEG